MKEARNNIYLNSKRISVEKNVYMYIYNVLYISNT